MIMPMIRKTLSLAVLLSSTALHADRTTIRLEDGWHFKKGTIQKVYNTSSFDDSNWSIVRVPHDWSISGEFNPSAHGSTGKLPWKGEGCYRRSFTIDSKDIGKRFYLDFDGVMSFPKVYLNGQLVGEWDYGYTPFRVDLTDYILFDSANTLSVTIDNQHGYSRWYPGAGIYRKVELTTSDPVHLAHWGTFAKLKDPEKLDTLKVQTRMENHTTNASDVLLNLTLVNAEGNTVAEQRIPVRIQANSNTQVEADMHVDSPIAWDIENPYLYTLKTELLKKDYVLDHSETHIGLRTIKFTANDGFILNGRRVQFYGVNLHHGLGPLGTAFNKRAAQRQLEVMKDMGVNAIRTSHNPPAEELLDLCDEMGLVVWDETFDKWDGTCGRDGSEPPLEKYGLKHLKNHMERDRNHPSVIIWSTGNEINPGENGTNPENVKLMADMARSIDDSRPIAEACNIPSLSYGGNYDSLDLTGWNYARRYFAAREVYPEKPIIYSESASALSTRGYYKLPLPIRHTDYLENKQVSSYDLTAAPWSDIADVEFDLMERDSYVQGEFVWTGIDYMGEPTPFDAEARSSYFGVTDLCVFPKDRYYLYRSYWRPDETTVHILPHWNWPDRVGKNVPVFVYTNGDSVELFLNGKSLGMRYKGELPDREPNKVIGASVFVSSTGRGTDEKALIDGDNKTTWYAAKSKENQWIEYDFGEKTHLGYIGFNFVDPEKNYAYTLSASTDGLTWDTLLEKGLSNVPLYEGPNRVFHKIDADARYLKVEFTKTDKPDRQIALHNVYVFSKPQESDYYDVTYKYRLRWNDVTYEPGELKVVAYKDGRVLGETYMRTAGKATQVRMKADRTELDNTGEDLCFITIDLADEKGTHCPNADDLVTFSLSGSAEIAAVGNGNPMSFESFRGNQRHLYQGKALLVIRPLKHAEGDIIVTASVDGLQDATLILKAK